MIIQISIEVLEQLEQHISQLCPEQYAEKLSVFNGASIGAHTRHIIEFYQCLLNGKSIGEVNYDARLRDLRIETQLDYTLDTIKEIKHRLLIVNDLDEKISLTSCFSNEMFSVPTNFAREAVYLIEHTIHHYALIRIGLQEHFPKVEIEPNFGYAHSTIKHQAEKKEKMLAICE